MKRNVKNVLNKNTLTDVERKVKEEGEKNDDKHEARYPIEGTFYLER